MTLVVTEISDVGIAMVADSKLTFDTTIAQGTFFPDKDRKLFHVPRINGGVSYWGAIGLVIANTIFPTFSDWLRAHISVSQATNIKDFAEGLASSLNYESKNTPFPKDKSMGVHVAAYGEWEDGKRRPIFYHVHNGDLHHEWRNREGTKMAVDPTGDRLGLSKPKSTDQCLRKELLESVPQGDGLSSIKPVLQGRRLFQAERDFPREGGSLAVNEANLKGGYATRNGDSALLSLRQQRQELARHIAVTGHTYPGDPGHTLDNSFARLLEEVHGAIDDLKVVGLPQTAGGKLWKLGIDENGYTDSSNLP